MRPESLPGATCLPWRMDVASRWLVQWRTTWHKPRKLRPKKWFRLALLGSLENTVTRLQRSVTLWIAGAPHSNWQHHRFAQECTSLVPCASQADCCSSWLAQGAIKEACHVKCEPGFTAWVTRWFVLFMFSPLCPQTSTFSITCVREKRHNCVAWVGIELGSLAAARRVDTSLDHIRPKLPARHHHSRWPGRLFGVGRDGVGHATNWAQWHWRTRDCTLPATAPPVKWIFLLWWNLFRFNPVPNCGNAPASSAPSDSRKTRTAWWNGSRRR